MTGQYAKQTQVPVDRSINEIKKMVFDRGGTSWRHSELRSTLVRIEFELSGRVIRFDLPLPEPDDDAFWKTPSGRRRRYKDQAEKEYQQAIRQRHRALCLTIKAKFVSIEEGIETLEQAFLPYLLIPGNNTVGAMVIPKIAYAYESNECPQLLPELENVPILLPAGEGAE